MYDDRFFTQGYPVHVPAKEFLANYQCLASGGRSSLPADPKSAARVILSSLKVPETEWQVGKTKVFLRHTIFEPLEVQRRKYLSKKALLIQKVWRGYCQRRQFLRMRWSAVTIQKNFRGSRMRINFVRMRKAAVVIQAHYRGMLAREFAAALRKKREEEEAERRRQKRLEDERRAKEMAEKTMEESYKEAQKELLMLAKMAEHRSKKAVKSTGEVDLDEMFKFLADDPKKKPGKEETSFLASITDDLEQMFRKADATSEPTRKPSRPAPKAPSPATRGGEQRAKPSLSRTQRRQRRVMKKLLGVEDEMGRKEEIFDPLAYPMTKFAEMYFNDFPKETGGFSTLSLRRAPKIKNPIPKSDMLTYANKSNLPTSLVHMHDPENVNIACGIFKDLCKLLRGDMKQDQYSLTIQSTIAYGIERPELRDEIFCQLIRQVTDNPKDESVFRGWHFLALCTIAFHPSKNFNKVCFLTQHNPLMIVCILCGMISYLCTLVLVGVS